MLIWIQNIVFTIQYQCTVHTVHCTVTVNSFSKQFILKVDGETESPVHVVLSGELEEPSSITRCGAVKCGEGNCGEVKFGEGKCG